MPHGLVKHISDDYNNHHSTLHDYNTAVIFLTIIDSLFIDRASIGDSDFHPRHDSCPFCCNILAVKLLCGKSQLTCGSLVNDGLSVTETKSGNGLRAATGSYSGVRNRMAAMVWRKISLQAISLARLQPSLLSGSCSSHRTSPFPGS